MTTLVTCPDCERHIRRSEAHCPFGGTSVAAEVSGAPERPLPTTRLSRAALWAFTAASVSATACGGEFTTSSSGNHESGGETNAGGDTSTGGAAQAGGKGSG